MDENHVLTNIYKVVSENNTHLLHLWLDYIVFSWRWWMQVALTIIPWIIWIKIRSKKDTTRLLFIAIMVALITNVLDVLGLCFDLWYYNWNLLPVTPIYIPWDLTLFPITIMLLLQIKPKTNKFIKAVGFAFMCAFIFEPIFSLLHIYEIVNWRFWYSFVIYIPLFLFFRWIYNSRLFYNCSNI